MKPQFTISLLAWNTNANSREMPWKGEKDAYKIWLSEIILQQTRVEQGMAYYNRFISHFPTVQQLAAAPEQEVFKLWEGLGYYSRCKNLIATARFVSNDLHGQFPPTYDGLKALRGIGPYTAAAIASFAFNLPHAVVDGNVIRVIARYFGISTPVSQSAGKALFSLLAQSLLDKRKPSSYNQAIMDFGAVICKPRQPLCPTCVQQKDCVAYRNNWVDILPVKEKKTPKKGRWFYYFIVENNGLVFIRKRGSKDIWENLYEFILVETEDRAFNLNQLTEAQMVIFKGRLRPETIFVSKEYRQQLTHQTITGQFIHLRLPGSLQQLDGYESVDIATLRSYPFPRFITTWLAEKTLFNP